MRLCSDFLPVFEGEPHIVFAAGSEEVYKPTKKDRIKFLHKLLM